MSLPFKRKTPPMLIGFSRIKWFSVCLCPCFRMCAHSYYWLRHIKRCLGCFRADVFITFACSCDTDSFSTRNTQKWRSLNFWLFSKCEVIGSTLAAIGKSLEDFEVISFPLAGLDSSYESLVTSITTRVDLIHLDDIFRHFLNHEARLEQVNIVVVVVASANVATRQDSSRGQNQYSWGHFPNNNSCGRGRGKVRGSFTTLFSYNLSSLR